MKKVTILLVTLFSIACVSQADARYYRGGYYGRGRGRGRGYNTGASFATGLAGGLVGGMVAGAATRGSSDGVSRGELEAKRAQDKTEQLAQQQQQVDMQKLRSQLAHAQTPAAPMFVPTQASSPMDNWMWPLMFLMFIVFILVGLAMYMFRSKKHINS